MHVMNRGLVDGHLQLYLVYNGPKAAYGFTQTSGWAMN